MTRSVEELRRESERNRAMLAATVDQLRERLSDTTEDLRNKVSPEHIKSEVSDYIGQKAQGWLGALKQRAMDNPMQAIAAGTAIAVPALRLARGVPLPLLMISAGLALTSKTVRGRASEAASPAMDKAAEVLNQTAERAQAFVGNVKDTVSLARSQADDLANDAQSRAGNLADNLSSRAANTASKVTDAAKDTVDRARSGANDTIEMVRDSAAAAPEKARRFVGENAALIGGIGIAIGAIIAAALPKTRAEATVMGGASDGVKQAAKEATQSGFEAVKDKTMSAADAAAQSVADSDLGDHAARITGNMAETLKEAAQDVVTAAVNPTRTPNT